MSAAVKDIGKDSADSRNRDGARWLPLRGNA